MPLRSFLYAFFGISLFFLSQAAISKKETTFLPQGAAVEQSIHFVRTQDAKTLYSYQPQKNLCPASLTKLLTSAALIAELGPKHRIITDFYYTGEFKEDTIHGDLIVEGKGDPFLVSENLWQITSDLRQKGLRKITGNLIIQQSLFSSPPVEALPDKAYASQPTSFSVNFNTISAIVSPATTLSKKAIVAIDPYPVNSVILTHNVKTIAGKKSNLKIKKKSSLHQQIGLHISGTIGIESPSKKLYKALSYPEINAGQILRSFLKGSGIYIKGKTLIGQKPTKAQLLYQHKSKNIGELVTSLQVYSNNFMTDTLVHYLGSYKNPHSHNTYQSGLKEIIAFTQKTVQSPNGIKITKGSGLSTKNRISAEQITDILVAISKDFRFFPEFISSLPIVGSEGTLQKRFQQTHLPALTGTLRAKTGSLTQPISVSGLAGYFHHPKHGLIAFALIQNGLFDKKQVPLLDLQVAQDKGLFNIYKTLSL